MDVVWTRRRHLNVYDVHLTSTFLPNATQNAPYSAQLAATGGAGSLHLHLQRRPAVRACTMTPGSGAISGRPNTGPGGARVHRVGHRQSGPVARQEPRDLRDRRAADAARHQVHGAGLADCTVLHPVLARPLRLERRRRALHVDRHRAAARHLARVHRRRHEHRRRRRGRRDLRHRPLSAGTSPIGSRSRTPIGASATHDFPLTVSPMGLWTDHDERHGRPGALGPAVRAGRDRSIHRDDRQPGNCPRGCRSTASGASRAPRSRAAGSTWTSASPTALSHTLDTSRALPDQQRRSTISRQRLLGSRHRHDRRAYGNQLSACCAPGYTWSPDQRHAAVGPDAIPRRPAERHDRPHRAPTRSACRPSTRATRRTSPCVSSGSRSRRWRCPMNRRAPDRLRGFAVQRAADGDGRHRCHHLDRAAVQPPAARACRWPRSDGAWTLAGDANGDRPVLVRT